jgi:N-acetylglucosamine-6-phosphate deacetylase
MQTAGLIDLQVNGYAGIDFNDAAIEPGALDHALTAMLQAGVATCLPTLITAPAPLLAERLAALDRAVAQSRLGPLMVPGFHLEGPFLNPTPGFAGCHPPDAMLPPDPALLHRLGAGLARPILLLTLAPEQEGGLALVAAARQQGMVVAIGHSAADAPMLARAAAAGATLSTHLGNALPHTLAKFVNPLMAHLAEDRLSASLIADGIHVPHTALKVLLRAKGLARAVLVTDATAAAATPPGIYRFAGMPIEHTVDGSVRVPGAPMLAGSALRLDQAVRNLVAWGLAAPHAAVRLAATNPAAILAPALAAHGLHLPPAVLRWSAALRPLELRLAGQCHRLAAPAAP